MLSDLLNPLRLRMAKRPLCLRIDVNNHASTQKNLRQVCVQLFFRTLMTIYANSMSDKQLITLKCVNKRSTSDYSSSET